MDFNSAFNINHVQPGVYGGIVVYDQRCIYCSHPESKGLLNDGGSFRQCNRCKKQFRANILGPPVSNYINSTAHLNPNNSSLIGNYGYQTILPNANNFTNKTIDVSINSNKFKCGICSTIQDIVPSADKYSSIQFCRVCNKKTFRQPF